MCTLRALLLGGPEKVESLLAEFLKADADEREKVDEEHANEL